MLISPGGSLKKNNIKRFLLGKNCFTCKFFNDKEKFKMNDEIGKKMYVMENVFLNMQEYIV